MGDVQADFGTFKESKSTQKVAFVGLVCAIIRKKGHWVFLLLEALLLYLYFLPSGYYLNRKTEKPPGAISIAIATSALLAISGTEEGFLAWAATKPPFGFRLGHTGRLEQSASSQEQARIRPPCAIGTQER